jgi:PHD/YefM family antitoxin component YafN of YafNO toxin-antitoxin module
VKRVVLKESRAPYTLTLGEEVLSEGPVILERDGEAVAAVISMAEYEAYRAWREAAQRETGLKQDLEAFERLKPELLRTHRGQWVAVYRGEVIEIGPDRSQVLDRVYSQLGYVQVYVQKVEEKPKVYKVPHRTVIG